MLNAHRQQAVSFQRERLAVTIERSDLYVLNPVDTFVLARYLQAALFVRNFAL